MCLLCGPGVACGLQTLFLGKRQNFLRGTNRWSPPVVGEKPVANDFRLLLKAVVFEAAARLDHISVAAEGVPHQRQIESPAFLRLPDMGQLVHEEALSMQRLGRKILGPKIGMRVEVDIAHGSHGNALRLERPPLAPDHAHSLVID